MRFLPVAAVDTGQRVSAARSRSEVP